MVVATQVRRGQMLILDGDLYRILKLTHITPGKGNAVVQSDLRNIRTGVKTEKRFRSSEDVTVAHVETSKMQYLYADAQHHFMDMATYEQYAMDRDLLEDVAGFLVPEQEYAVDIHDGRPIGVTLPSSVVLKIVRTDPPQKGDAGKRKPATANTGLVVQVPLFVAEGDQIMVSTEDGGYLERA